MSLKGGDSIRIEYVGNYYAKSDEKIKVEKIMHVDTYVTEHNNTVYSFFGIFHAHGEVGYGQWDKDYTVIHFVCYRNNPLNMASIVYKFDHTEDRWLEYTKNTYSNKWDDEDLKPSDYLIRITR